MNLLSPLTETYISGVCLLFFVGVFLIFFNLIYDMRKFLWYAVVKHVINLFLIACDEGLYGLNCSEKCGHCRDIKQCSHLDGMCTTGCDAGFQGTLCETRRYFIRYDVSMPINGEKIRQFYCTSYI